MTTPEMTPVPVRLHPDDLDALIKGQGKIRKRRAMRTNTYTLNAANPVVAAFPQANNRVEGWITSALGFSEQDTQVANPAAGANAVYTVTQPGQLMAASFTAVTSAVAANRQGFLEVKSAAGNVIFYAIATNSQTATETAVYTFAQGFGGAVGLNAALITSMGEPDVQLLPGWTVTLGLNNIQAGDQISAVNLTLAASTPVVFISGSQAGAAGQAGGASQVSGLDTTPFPVNTTDQVWISAAGSTATVSTLGIYEEDE